MVELLLVQLKEHERVTLAFPELAVAADDVAAWPAPERLAWDHHETKVGYRSEFVEISVGRGAFFISLWQWALLVTKMHEAWNEETTADSEAWQPIE